jgi:hypothetical protein
MAKYLIFFLGVALALAIGAAALVDMNTLPHVVHVLTISYLSILIGTAVLAIVWVFNTIL